MHLANSSDIRAIDQYAIEQLHISIDELIHRAGDAVASAVRAHTPTGGFVVLLCGAGNNGADGYAAACALLDEYCVRVVDVFDHSSRHRSAFEAIGGHVVSIDAAMTCIADADCLVDAVFGTGFHGDIPAILYSVSDAYAASAAYKIAVDVPLGVDADLGRVLPYAMRADATVVLSFVKAGLVSYPGAAYVGALIHDTIGLPLDLLATRFPSKQAYIDADFVRAQLPQRPKDANKASFGSVCLYTGCEVYRGAAHLSLSAALRCGVGYTHFVGNDAMIETLLPNFPEALYHSVTNAEQAISALTSSNGARATLIGCGSGCTEELYTIVQACMMQEGGPLILDADAINALYRFGTVDALKRAKRTVVLTPHPKEFSRLSGYSMEQICADRLHLARCFASEFGIVLVLKGAGTIVADAEYTYINSSGSTALSKAGSGDVLAGVIAALCAQSSPTVAAALAVYLHGAAADSLERELSAFGVTPSDLPKQIAREIQALLTK